MPVSVPSAETLVTTADEFNALEARVAELEKKPPSPPDDDLEQRVNALEVEVDSLDTRVTALENEEPEPPDPPDPPEPEPGALVCTVVLNGARYPFDETDATDLGDFVDPRGRFVMTCKRLNVPGCPITVDFRHAGDWSCMIFQFGDPNDQTGAELPPYTVEIPSDAKLQFKAYRRRGKIRQRLASINVRLNETLDIPCHYKFSRWRWTNMDWPFPLADIGELVDAGLLPWMSSEVACGTAWSQGPVYYEPMGIAGLFPQMNAGGGRPDIGFVTNWQAEYICAPSQTALDNVIAQGEAGGSWPWYMRDPADAAIIDPLSEKWKSASFYGTTGNPRLVHGPQGGLVIDSAHEPAISYLPYVLTGDPYYLENLQAQVVYFITSCPGGWWNQGNYIWKPLGMGQTRGVAWMTRDVMQAARVTPETVPSWLLPQSRMRDILMQGTIPGFNAIMAAPENLRTVLHAVAGSRGDYDNTGPGGTIPGGCWYATWQEDFVACVVGWGVMMHPDIPELEAFAEWHINGLIDRVDPTSNSGWNDGWTELYWKAFQDTRDGPQYDSWSTAWDRNSEVQGLVLKTLDQSLNDAGAYDYINGLQAGLAMACQAGITAAQPARDKLVAAMNAGLTARKGAKDYKWCVE